MNRPLSEQEKDWMRQALTDMELRGAHLDEDAWTIAYPSRPFAPESLRQQLGGLVVAGECPCGCGTIYTQHFKNHHASAVTFYRREDGCAIVVHVDDSGQITEMEVIKGERRRTTPIS